MASSRGSRYGRLAMSLSPTSLLLPPLSSIALATRGRRPEARAALGECLWWERANGLRQQMLLLLELPREAAAAALLGEEEPQAGKEVLQTPALRTAPAARRHDAMLGAVRALSWLLRCSLWL